MAVVSAQTTITSTRARISANLDDDHSPGASVLIRNRGSVSVWIGGPAVSASNGFEVQAGETISLELTGGDKLYAVTSSGSSTCHIVQAGV
jgi:hypothetical protein